MRRVNHEEWHATVGQLDIVPRCERDASYWETRDRRLMGKTTPGFIAKGEKAYFVSAEYDAAYKARHPQSNGEA